MLFLNNDDVARVIDMPLCLDSLESLFLELARGDAVGMGRMDMYVPSDQEAPYHRLALMVGGSRKDGYACIRIISDMVSWPMVHGHRRENKYAREPGTWCGLLMLFSARDATPVAMMNDGRLQHDRVGAGAGLGAKYLAREDSSHVAMIGSGGMAPELPGRALPRASHHQGERLQPQPGQRTAVRGGDEDAPQDRGGGGAGCADRGPRRRHRLLLRLGPSSRCSSPTGWSPACASST